MTKKEYLTWLGSEDDLLPEHRVLEQEALMGWDSSGPLKGHPANQGLLHWKEIARAIRNGQEIARRYCWSSPVHVVSKQIITAGRGRKRWKIAVTIIITYGIDDMKKRWKASQVGRARLSGNSEGSEEE